jgi:sialate O-acetylesterase
LQTLASDWRSAFGAVPLLVVQLANFMERHTAPVESNWAALRDAQRRAANSIPNAALATAVDLGEWNDIHPLNKKDLAHRLALQARRLYLGEKKLVAEGPAYEHCEARDGKIYLTFRNGTDDFQTATRDGDLAGFTIAGADKRFRPARARIEGKQVVVWSDKVAQPLTVRYGWDDNPLLSLYGANGLPAATFEAHAQ